MKLICGPETFLPSESTDALHVVLYGQAGSTSRASAGDAAKAEILRRKLSPTSRAWDFLSIALAAVTADFAAHRSDSPDGWTREFEVDIAVGDPNHWNAQSEALSKALGFLTTDKWQLKFFEGGVIPVPPREVEKPVEDCVVLLSGGLDSLIGTIDLVHKGLKPYAISQTVRGDAEKQESFASLIGGGLSHLQLNHNADTPGDQEPSQRARSLIFIAFAVLTATCLKHYSDGNEVPLFLCENGFIAINPPLTGGRIGSLSTRTAHPEFLSRLQDILNASGLRVRIENPYAEKTKGEMLVECRDQAMLKQTAALSTSCGRYQRFNYTHCGRCIPCQVRRASFLRWNSASDTTKYLYDDLGQDDEDHANFDDVRSLAIALEAAKSEGSQAWLGYSLGSPRIVNRPGIEAMLERGLIELKALHQQYQVK